ncbi:mannose-1-phosphate guanylyltransferase/mannose-6-phosphate isomerase [bacterium]|nr:mannose-1-phosphate guanylyltransferase/mannose-6-phosphate isomerase [bacterium]
MYGIILAGGSGSRLWPLSRELYPKQLLKLDGKLSLLQGTFKRLSKFIKSEDIISITNIKHVNDVKYQIEQIDKNSTILAEPIAKNTAPAIAVALEYLKQIKDREEIVIIVPSDPLIKNDKAFEETVKEGIEAAKNGYIVTFGIKPSYPETGYGYIKTTGEIFGINKVEKFVEKPDLETAKKYIANDCYFWNGGIFMAKVSTLLEEFQKYTPEIYQNLSQINFKEANTIKYGTFENMPSISIDYAIMEKSSRIALCPLKSDWCDLGSWQSLYDVSEKDKNGNVLQGNIIEEEVQNSFIYSDKKVVAAIGLKDVIIVNTEDAILACNKNDSQAVKKVYEKLKKDDNKAHLVHKTVFRPWGWYTCLAEGDCYLTKIICVSPGQKLSIQSHNHRSEHWVVLEGNAKVILNNEEYFLNSGQSIDIPLQAIHSLQNPYDVDLKIIEVQKGDYLSEDDIIRYEDIYGRV